MRRFPTALPGRFRKPSSLICRQNTYFQASGYSHGNIQKPSSLSQDSPTTRTPPTAMDHEAFRTAAHAAIEEIIAYNTNIASYPVLPTIKPGYLAPLLPNSAPQSPQPWSAIQPDIAKHIIPGLTHWASPKFMAFFPATVTYPSLLGEMYSAAFNAPAFNWLCSPACTELETVVMDWLAKAFALPPAFLSTSGKGGGTIQGSASEAIVTCMVAARERYLFRKCESEGLQPDTMEWDDRIAFLRGRLVALSSDQAHSSTQKGARIAGTLYRSIPTSYTQDLSLAGASLQQKLDECAAQGLEPYYITLTLGTTSTCTVDDFATLLPILAKYPNLWIHVDAAYAGASLICPEYSTLYSPFMTHVNSFNMNMHKWLLVNFDASCLFVQDRNDLTRALSISAAYYENKMSSSGLVTDYRDWQIPLGRRFRALKIWFVMRTFGVEGMQRHIRRTVGLGEMFAGWVREEERAGIKMFEVVGTPRFALTCFRVRPALLASMSERRMANGSATAATDIAFDPLKAAAEDLEQTANALTKQITDLITERGEIFLTGSSAGGKTFIRVVSANSNAEEKYVREAWQVIVQATDEVLELWRIGRKEGANGHAH